MTSYMDPEEYFGWSQGGVLAHNNMLTLANAAEEFERDLALGQMVLKPKGDRGDDRRKAHNEHVKKKNKTK